MKDFNIVSDLKIEVSPYLGTWGGFVGKELLDLGLGLNNNERTLTDLLCPIKLISRLFHQLVFL